MPDSAPASRLRAAAAVMRIAWTADPRRSVFAFGLQVVNALAQSLLAWWLKLVLDGLAARDSQQLAIAVFGIAASIAISTGLTYAAEQVQMELRDRAHHLIELHLIDMVGTTPTLDIHETPEHLTQLEVLDEEAWQFGQVIPAVIGIATTIVRTITTTLLLLAVHPLLLLLPLFGLPALLLSSKTSALYWLGNERAAEPARLAEHLYQLATTAPAAKEVRMFDQADELLRRFHITHQQIRRIHSRVNLQGEAIGLATRLVFLVGYCGAIIFVADRAIDGAATIGDAALTAVLAGQVLGLLTGAAGGLQFAWRSLAAASRYIYLRNISDQTQRTMPATAAAPEGLAEGIRLHHLSYRYPHSNTDAIHDVDLLLRAGTTVALVGDNGAGKTTLVKLLAGLYRPTHGAITIDGIHLNAMDPTQWRRRISAGFQDHARFEFLLREAVGIGDLTNLDDDQAVRAALQRAGAADLHPRLDSQLGPNWPDGVDLSGGQWQKVALGRAMMRTQPLLLLLDEPTAALDAETEHRLFASWTAAAEHLRKTTGAVTILVSHRFSTVRMADHIIVLDHGRIIESGTHTELIDAHGRYAELYELQSRSYR